MLCVHRLFFFVLSFFCLFLFFFYKKKTLFPGNVTQLKSESGEKVFVKLSFILTSSIT